MQKVLRSLIHEMFPEDLRLEILKLSKRRDILNEKKQDKLFEKLREYDFNDITPLGPGTNRYAFKINGFVVKFATNKDGIIDNFKEFKMAKRLYPYVTKVYEVAENGTLLVAEYIQPFNSYGEMYQHADQIREILTKLSSVYLIGDVGIQAKNYANWGLRIGSDEPVCLDFAYVYNVSSELFICRKCKNNSMLFPDKDFVKLICPAPGCGASYEFEDIRRRIGNDLHKHEIGDLSEEGYLMEGSNILTELDPKRSNYLVKPAAESKKVVEEAEEVAIDNFELQNDLSYYMHTKEGNAMQLNTEGMNLRPVVKATAVVRTSTDELAFSGEMESDVPVIPATIINHDNGTMTDSETPVVDAQAVVTNENVDEESIEMPPHPVVGQATIPIDVVTVKKNIEEAQKTVDETGEPVITAQQQPEEPSDQTDPNFSKKFIDGSHYAVSKIGTLIQESMMKSVYFDSIKNDIIQRKMYPADFYKALTTAIYKAIVGFAEFEQIDIPNGNKPGTHRGFKAPAVITGKEYEPTMIFIQRMFIDERLNHSEDIDTAMAAYHQYYGDNLGLQREILPLIRSELAKRIQMTEGGYNNVIDTLDRMVFVPIEVDDLRVVAEAITAAVDEGLNYELKNQLDAQVAEELAAEKESPAEDITSVLAGIVNQAIDEPEELAFSSDADMQDDADYEDAEEDDYIPTTVEIYHEDDVDVIKVNTADAFGRISIPFYTKLDAVNPDETMPSLVDDRNGAWDWLTAFVPMLMFRTDNPDHWLELNDYEIHEEFTHPVILDEMENGPAVMGLYLVDGIYDINPETGERTMVEDAGIIWKLNKIVNDNIATGDISHLKRTVVREDLILSEEDIQQYIVEEEEDDTEEVEPSESENESISDLQDAAIKALLGGNDEPEETAEEVIGEEVDPDELDPSPEESLIFQPIRKPTTK